MSKAVPVSFHPTVCYVLPSAVPDQKRGQNSEESVRGANQDEEEATNVLAFPAHLNLQPRDARNVELKRAPAEARRRTNEGVGRRG